VIGDLKWSRGVTDRIPREGTLGREIFGRVTATGVEAILAPLAATWSRRLSRGEAEGATRVSAVGRRSGQRWALSDGTNNPPGERAVLQSESGVVKRSIPRS